ncbi:PHD finger protein 21B isoform X2 [Brachyhypopomus gauderio]|uniref:PHD finger protein 21B isoform X2 n=1 Tax=Brachyhypopomus gauderio TaxID=698409 RepID=UPI004040F275
MELQGLQEALKVEIQCHQKLVAQMKQDPQDGELKKQPHDRQSRITTLSEKQLAVRSCPVGTPAKPLSLIKAPSQSIAISVVPAKAPVSMVTAHMNGQKAAGSEGLQTSPINLQTGGRTAAVGAQTLGRRAGELCHSQMLGTFTAVPIKVPQVSSLHRLAGQSPTVLPQVRPKTLIPDSLPHNPCQEQQSGQPVSLARGTAVVSPRGQGPALPVANSTFSPERGPASRPNSSPPPPSAPSVSAAAAASPGVAYAIISAASPAGNGLTAVSETMKVPPLLFSPDSKMIIIQPQAPSSSQTSPGAQADSPAKEPSPVPSSPHKTQKKTEDPEKIAFMVALGLVTTEHLEEIQTKRQERKRRSTANPAYSNLFEPERKRLASNYLNNPLFLSARVLMNRGQGWGPCAELRMAITVHLTPEKPCLIPVPATNVLSASTHAPDSEDLCWKEELEHDDHCAVCKEDGEVQQCHTCPRVYHLECLAPPLKAPPKGMWMCPKCQKKVLNKENLSWPHNFVQSYVTHKAVREEEKRKLMRRNSELKKECAHLKEEDQRLSKSLSKCMDLKERLLSQQRDTQASLERLRALIRLIQRDQMIQVTMTATTTTTAGASLLSLPWIKPTSSNTPSTTATVPPAGTSTLLQKSVAQSQGNN